MDNRNVGKSGAKHANENDFASVILNLFISFALFLFVPFCMTASKPKQKSFLCSVKGRESMDA